MVSQQFTSNFFKLQVLHIILELQHTLILEYNMYVLSHDE